jgi:ATP-dependent DNA ligase
MFYAFDVSVRRGEDLMKLPLSKRREILVSTVKPHDHVGISEVSNQTAKEMLAFVKSHGLEGIIAKRTDSVYEPGRRSGLWVKRRINLSQEFVIGRPCAQPSRSRFHRHRLLSGQAIALCGAGTRRLRATDEASGVREDQANGDNEVSVRESTRKRCRAMGTGLTAEKMKECERR